MRSELAEALHGRLRRSPLDFVRAMDPASGGEAWLADLTRPIPQEHDLTFVADLADAGPTAVFSEILPWDSRFFGFKVAKVQAVIRLADPEYQVLADVGAAIDDLLARCRQAGVKYVLAPVDARDTGVSRSLTSRGFEFIESRLCYHRSLDDFHPPGRYAVRCATADDVEALGDVAVRMVNPYDRFHADPQFAGDPADRMMREWVRASVCGGFADATLVPDVAIPGAFLTIKYHRDRWDRWGVALGQAPFGAVGPAFKGWYVKLISEVCCHLAGVGARHFFMVSQATNSAVVRCWEKLGLLYGRNELIFRMVL